MIRLCRSGNCYQSHPAARRVVNSKRPSEGEVEAVGAGQRVLALGQEMDAMERPAIRPAPDDDVAVDQRNAPGPVGARLAAPKEDGRPAIKSASAQVRSFGTVTQPWTSRSAWTFVQSTPSTRARIAVELASDPLSGDVLRPLVVVLRSSSGITPRLPF
jgi:hypothetical protein